VFAVVAVELIPDLLRDHQPLLTVIGFALGVAVMLAIRSITHAKAEHEDEERKSLRPEAAASTKLPLGMLSGVAIDLAVDGLMIGIGFAAGAKEGRLLAVALSVELISLGLAVAASLSKLGIERRRSILVVAGLSTTFIVGAGGGVLLLGNLSSHALAGVLAFGAAALMFLVTEELLTETHEEKETPLLTATFFAGFLAFLILGMVA
jgi:ZIP family zinc transporter